MPLRQPTTLKVYLFFSCHRWWWCVHCIPTDAHDIEKVSPDDFLYIERIGEGGFGRVVHVKKKSTQTHYAMKIQLKTALLDTFNDDPSRIDHER